MVEGARYLLNKYLQLKDDRDGREELAQVDKRQKGGATSSYNICYLACKIAQTPGFSQEAGQILNLILRELCEDYTFEAARGTSTFSFTGSTGPYALPSDFLRSKFKDTYYVINGIPYFPKKASQEEYDALIQQAGLASYPSVYTVDMSASPPNMFFWPPPAAGIASGAAVTVRYQRQMPDIVDPEINPAIPWFANTEYLITRLAGELLRLSGQYDKASGFLGMSDGSMGIGPGAEFLLQKYLRLKDNKEDEALHVQLDPRRFNRSVNSGLANAPLTKNLA